MSQPPTTPEAKRAERLTREAAQVAARREQHDSERKTVSVILLALGVGLIAIGLWFLLVSPSVGTLEGQPIANFHKLTLGATSTLAGAILFATGALLRYRIS
jgi:hypothetical protein